MNIARQIAPAGIAARAIAARNGSGALSTLVQRAATQLASAATAAEVLDAKDLASVAYDAAKKAARLHKAKGAHDELVAKAHRAQADALEIEAAAKRRLADEYDAAQERGEVATRADQNLLPEEKKVGVGDLGMTHKDIHEARQLRDAEDADPGVVERTVNDALAKGEEPTKAKVRAAVAKANKSEEPAVEAEQEGKANARNGSRINVSEGMTVESVVRKGMALEEAEGLSTEDIAKRLAIGKDSYRRARYMVMLADNADLSLRDAELALAALKELNETGRIGEAYAKVERLIDLIWGSERKGDQQSRLAAKRAEQFERSFGILIQTCLTTEEVDLPYIAVDRAKKAVKQITEARAALLRFADRIKGIHE